MGTRRFSLQRWTASRPCARTRRCSTSSPSTRRAPSPRLARSLPSAEKYVCSPSRPLKFSLTSPTTGPEGAAIHVGRQDAHGERDARGQQRRRERARVLARRQAPRVWRRTSTPSHPEPLALADNTFPLALNPPHSQAGRSHSSTRPSASSSPHAGRSTAAVSTPSHGLQTVGTARQVRSTRMSMSGASRSR